MLAAPLDRLNDLLPPAVRRVVDRDTPIPTIAIKAGQVAKSRPELVRADIGQITDFDAALEVPYGPPVGLEELRQVIAETFTRALRWKERGMTVLPDGLTARNVAICTGAAEGLSVLFRCFAAGKNVGLPRVHWENYTNGVELAGGTPVYIDFFDDAGALDIAGIRRQILEHNLSLLVVNFPCNPTGAVLNEAENAALGKLLEDTGCLVIADDVYYRLRYDGHPPTSLLTAAPGHVISVGAASKEYLLPGGRIGYVVCANADLTDRVVRKMVRAGSASPNVLGQKRLLELMGADLADLRAGKEPGLLSRVRAEMAHRRDRLVEVLEKHGFPTLGRAGHRPEGTIFLMAGLPSWWTGDDVSFADAAMAAACVSVVPGSAFGLPGSVRFSYGSLTAARIGQLETNLAAFRAGLG